jgi:hypothetical protein
MNGRSQRNGRIQPRGKKLSIMRSISSNGLMVCMGETFCIALPFWVAATSAFVSFAMIFLLRNTKNPNRTHIFNQGAGLNIGHGWGGKATLMPLCRQAAVKFWEVPYNDKNESVSSSQER